MVHSITRSAARRQPQPANTEQQQTNENDKALTALIKQMQSVMPKFAALLHQHGTHATVFTRGTCGEPSLHVMVNAPKPKGKQGTFLNQLVVQGHKVVVILTTEDFEGAVLDYLYGRADAEGNRPNTMLYVDRPTVN
jgi:hypothetical protein